MIQQLVILPVFLASISAFAATPEFYTIRENSEFVSENEASSELSNLLDTNSATTVNPLATLEIVAHDLETQTSRFVSLLKWDHHETSLDEPAEPYNRLRHFGTWLIEDIRRGGCIDTRAKVLQRQSSTRVTYNETGCRVVSGTWRDVYNETTVTEAAALDIDHVVPLKNSYMSGGWKWDRQKRCAYANFMANPYHLIAVNSSANRRKGQDGPEHYMPESQRFACDYLNIWLKIKLVWGLALPSEEATAISQLLSRHGCNLAKMSMSVDDLSYQRRQIVNQTTVCASGI